MWRQVASVGGLTLLSRLFGFVRDMAMAALLGAGPLADAFMIAFRLPNHFRAIFAEGAFNAAFLPRYTAVLNARGEDEARAFSGMVLVLTLLAQLVVLAVALTFTPQVVRLLAPGFTDEPAQFAHTVELTRITFPYLTLIAVMTLITGMLNAHGRFAAAASAPILLNICMIGALFLEPWFPSVAHALAWGVTASGVAQLVWVWADLRLSGSRLSLAWPRWNEDMRAFLRAFGPAILGSAGIQLAMFADTIIASFLPAGSVSYLYYADRLYQLPLAVLGIALGTVLLPDLAKQFALGDGARARTRLNRAVEGAMALTLPCVVAFLFMAEPLNAVLFGRGEFDAAAVAGSARALEAYAIGLLAVIVIRAFTSAFYARGDTATPVKALVAGIVVNIALKIALMGTYAHAGLAFGTAAGAWVNVLLLGFFLYRQGDFTPDERLLRFGGITVSAALAMAAVTIGLGPQVRALNGLIPFAPDLAPLMMQGSTALLVYGAVVWAGWKLAAR